jgi:hypothetical protein
MTITSTGARFFTQLVAIAMLSVCSSANAQQWNPDETFAKGTKVISVEGGLGHFGDRLPGSVQEWNVAARFSILPFNVVHLNRTSIFDGSFEVGLEPVFERFNTKRQNWAGLAVETRYYLTGLRFDRVVPWVAASIGPGGSDLNIGSAHDGTRLEGSFLARITGEVGFAYFFDDTKAVYIGLQGTHFSNGSMQHGSVHNNSLNTPWAGIIGVSWYFH